jgi:ABC-2 type transport system ATP-binding protein
VGLIGPNGAGKTSTMRMIGGVLAPTAGKVVIGGYDVVTHRLDALAQLGYLAEQPATFDNLRALDYLTFMAQVHRCTDVDRAIATATALTHAGPHLHRPMHTLSKGQRQRVFVAGAILHTPPLLVLDEPTDGLDPNQKHELRLVLQELAKRGTAILLSTHILEEAEAICSRVMILHEGKLKLDCTPAELARQGKGDIQLAFRVLTQNKGVRRHA